MNAGVKFTKATFGQNAGYWVEVEGERLGYVYRWERTRPWRTYGRLRSVRSVTTTYWGAVTPDGFYLHTHPYKGVYKMATPAQGVRTRRQALDLLLTWVDEQGLDKQR